MHDLLAEARKQMQIDMTPMIDCIFLLMIFFTLVVDLSQQNLEDLVLPAAKYQQSDDSPPRNRPVLNILQDGSIAFKGSIRVDRSRAADGPQQLTDLLRQCKQSLQTPGANRADGGTGPVLIRADKWTEWTHVRQVLQQCSRPEIGFLRIELALSQKDKEAAPPKLR
jgi:biopolymer transport protein ExbD